MVSLSYAIFGEAQEAQFSSYVAVIRRRPTFKQLSNHRSLNGLSLQSWQMSETYLCTVETEGLRRQSLSIAPSSDTPCRVKAQYETLVLDRFEPQHGLSQKVETQTKTALVLRKNARFVMEKIRGIMPEELPFVIPIVNRSLLDGCLAESTDLSSCGPKVAFWLHSRTI